MTRQADGPFSPICELCGLRVVDGYRCRYGDLAFCTLCFDDFNRFLDLECPDCVNALGVALRRYRRLRDGEPDDLFSAE